MLLFLAGLSAQSLTSLNGTVSDPTGAVIPGTAITIENVDRGLKRDTVSDQAGRYSFQQVQPGNYKLTAKAAGFTDVVINEVRLLVNLPATVNVQFQEVGATSTTVSVSAEAAQVNTTDASLGNAVGTRPIMELPFEGRNVIGLLSLQAGVTYLGNGRNFETDYRQGSVAGGRSDQANVTLDGVDVNDQQNRTAFTSVLRPTLDSVEEFRVTTVNPTADFGRSGGAQIALVTKSGTNEYHGSLYEYHRNTLTSANRFFNNASGVDREKLIRNVFGASVGAPIKQNRVFYFLNYEGRRDAQDGSAVRVVPTDSYRQGIVKYLNQDGGVSTLNPEDIKRIDPAGIGVSQVALDVLNSYPHPNTAEVGEGLNTSGFRFTAPTPLRWNTYIARIDTFLDKDSRHSLFFRGHLQNDNKSEMPQFPGQPASSVELSNNKGLAVGYNAVLRPNLISTTRYGLTRQSTENTGALMESVIALNRDLDYPFATTRGIARLLPVHQFSEDLSWTKGSHSLKFGAVARIIRNKRNDYQNSFFSGSTNSAWLKGTGIELRQAAPGLDPGFNNAYSEAILGALGGVTQVNAQYNYDIDGNPLAVGEPTYRNFAAEEYEMYAQDTWNVRRGLTITAGLRWSLMPPVHETQGYQTTALPYLNEWFAKRGDLAAAGRPQYEAGDLSYVRFSDPQGRGLYPFDKKLFSPRLAIAYSPRGDSGWRKWLFGGEGKTTIRAGAGILYDVYGQSIMRLASANQLGFSSSLQNPAGVLTVAGMPRLTSLTQMPESLIMPAPAAGFPQIPPAEAMQISQTVDDSLRAPYSINLNFSIAREFSHGFVLEGSYVGRLSHRVLTEEDVAQPTNLVDKASGQSYFQAAQSLARQAREGVPVEQVKPEPFWENMFPDAAQDPDALAGGFSATQRMYMEYEYIQPDYLTVLYDADAYCYPACSVFGPYSMFQNQYSALSVMRSIGRANYHAMQWTLRKRFGSGAQMDANYTWSKSIDWGSGIENQIGTDGYNLTGMIMNAWDRRQNIAVSDWDMRHQFNMSGILELPFGRGKRFGTSMGKGLDALVGGWQLGGIWRWTSGLPTYVYNGRAWPTEWNLAGYGMPTGPLQTSMGVFKNAPGIDGNSGPNIFADPQKALDSYTFSLPGQSGVRNTLRGDGIFNIDASLSKRFQMPFSENHNLQLRWEVFNVANSVRFDPGSIANAGNNFLTLVGGFGKYTDQIVEPRVMQFGLRYQF
ncbi:MAG: carboxypeptidase regulatory-like domain-containing protein [Acidobacteriota bacterium]